MGSRSRRRRSAMGQPGGTSNRASAAVASNPEAVVSNSDALQEGVEEEEVEASTPLLDAVSEQADVPPDQGEEEESEWGPNGPPAVVAENAKAPEDAAEEATPGDMAVENEVDGSGKGDENPIAAEQGVDANASAEGATRCESPAPGAEPMPPQPVAAVDPTVTSQIDPELAPQAPVTDRAQAAEFKAQTGISPEQQGMTCKSMLQGLGVTANELQAELAGRAPEVTSRIDAMVDTHTGSLRSSAGAVEGQVRSAFANARGQVDSDAESAIGQVQGSAQTMLGNLEGALAGHMADLEGRVATENARLAQVTTNGKDAMRTAIEAAAQNARQSGEQAAQAATQRSAARAGAYRAAGLGDSLEGRRNAARAEAAVKVGESYAGGFRDRGEQTATELMQAVAGAQEAVQQANLQVAEALATTRGQMEAAVQDQVTTARDTITQQAEQGCEAIETARSNTSQQLDEQEEASVTSLRGGAGNAASALETAGQEGRAKVFEFMEIGSAYFDKFMAQVAEYAATQNPSDPELVAAVVAEYEAELEGSSDEMMAMLEQVLGEMDGKLGEQTAEAIAGLQQAGQTAASSAGQAANDFRISMQGVCGQIDTQFEDIARGADEGIVGILNQGMQGYAQCIDTFQTSLTQQGATISSDMAAVVTGLDQQFAQAMGGLDNDISEEARKAAQKIQPAWKAILSAVVSIVVAVVVFVVVAAICVVTFGAGLVVAGIIAGACAGVAALFAADCVNMATGVQDGFSSMGTYACAAIGGAVGGGLGAFTAPMGALATGVITGIGVGVTDSITRVAILRDDFSWSRLGVMTLVSGLTAGLAAKFFNPAVADRFDDAIAGQSGRGWNLLQSANKTENFNILVADNMNGQVGGLINNAAADAVTPASE